ncbi:hypothetical protein GRI44_13740 [Altererythrobacter confluentis]|uniref:Uncharacterized protein n=1 Tax=Allopontixanthobacter confluentis TaxID=1849021 RepID=A0A6L7GMF8_9SPHN|nr:hypothetical protein [Allopontixanthobacter confluentis]MXP15811.1 hypothetical protein [Allopontixanthobacter confluentis]
MRIISTIIITSLVAILTACGEDQPEEPYVYRESPQEMARNKAAYEKEQAVFAAIEYGDCGEIWRDSKLTTCGKERLKVSLDYCAKKLGSGSRLSLLSAGDSWIDRAGRSTMQTIDERAERITENDYISEGIAFASGNGTNSIEIVRCSMNRDIRVQRIDSDFK